MIGASTQSMLLSVRTPLSQNHQGFMSGTRHPVPQPRAAGGGQQQRSRHGLHETLHATADQLGWPADNFGEEGLAASAGLAVGQDLPGQMQGPGIGWT